MNLSIERGLEAAAEKSNSLAASLELSQLSYSSLDPADFDPVFSGTSNSANKSTEKIPWFHAPASWHNLTFTSAKIRLLPLRHDIWWGDWMPLRLGFRNSSTGWRVWQLTCLHLLRVPPLRLYQRLCSSCSQTFTIRPSRLNCGPLLLSISLMLHITKQFILRLGDFPAPFSLSPFVEILKALIWSFIR